MLPDSTGGGSVSVPETPVLAGPEVEKRVSNVFFGYQKQLDRAAKVMYI